MYPDFLWVAADQVFNQVGKARHMFGGRNPVPLVLRTKVAMGSGYGSQHLMDPAGIFATSPGWRIMAPSTPFDYIGMMNAALAIDDPVLVLEHVDLYGTEGAIPVADLDYQVPFGTAAVCREGREVTVLTYLSMVEQAAIAIEATGIDADSSTCGSSTGPRSTGRPSGRASARPTPSSSSSRAPWAPPTAGGSRTRYSGGSSTGSTSQSSGSPAARRARPSPRSWSGRRSPRRRKWLPGWSGSRRVRRPAGTGPAAAEGNA